MALGIIKRWETKARVYYEIDAHSPFFRNAESAKVEHRKGRKKDNRVMSYRLLVVEDAVRRNE